MMKTRVLLLSFICYVGALSSFAQPGQLDPDFGGGDGWVTTTLYSNLPAQGNAVAVQTDGKILVCGYTKASDGKSYGYLLRYKADGALDDSFNGTGKILIPSSYPSAGSSAIVIQPDKKILITLVANDSMNARFFLYRFNIDGSPDITFSDDGVTQDSLGAKYLWARAIALQPDGKILLGGYVGYGNDLFDRFWIERFLPNGVPDHSFDGDGLVITTVGEAYTGLSNLLVQGDGKIVATGYATFNGNDDFVAVRYNSNGSLDHSFSGDGIANATISGGDDRSYDAALQPDGKIVLVGHAFSSSTGHSGFAAARFNSDGTLDLNFHGNGMVQVMVSEHADGGRCVVLQPDGKIVIGGYAHSDITGGFDMALVRLNPNGIPDFDFDGDGVKIYEDDDMTESDLAQLALQPDGKIVGTGLIRFGFLNTIRVSRFITGLTTGTQEESMPVTEVHLYPNPVTEKVVVNYTLDKAQTISISLCDLQGRIVRKLLSSVERNIGRHTETLSVNQSLPPGNYFVMMQAKEWLKAMEVMIE
jgi:uncharacterized delta-60 repeat protein